MTQAPRDFYDTAYHFAQDVARPDESRIRRSIRFLGNLQGTRDIGVGNAPRLEVHLESLEHEA